MSGLRSPKPPAVLSPGCWICPCASTQIHGHLVWSEAEEKEPTIPAEPRSFSAFKQQNRRICRIITHPVCSPICQTINLPSWCPCKADQQIAFISQLREHEATVRGSGGLQSGSVGTSTRVAAAPPRTAFPGATGTILREIYTSGSTLNKPSVT